MIFTKRFKPSQSLLRAQHGAVLPMVALCIGVLVAATGAGVDVGRMYMVKSKLQHSLDGALAGAVTTRAEASTPLQKEFASLLNTNFASGYMGGALIASSVAETPAGSGTFLATADATVPLTLMRVLGSAVSTIHVESRYSLSAGKPLNLALSLVLDNTASMQYYLPPPNSVPRMQALISASKSLVDVISGGREDMSKRLVNLVPFNVAVNLYHPVSTVRDFRNGWAQALYRPHFRVCWGRFMGELCTMFIANHNFDSPRKVNDLEDPVDAPPTTEATRFRMPLENAAGATQYPTPTYAINAVGRQRITGGTIAADYSALDLAPVAFALDKRSNLHAELNVMKPGTAGRRINVGLHWGWMMLSPKWQGLWDSSRSNLPAAKHAGLLRVAVVVTDGSHKVFIGSPTGSISNDNETLLATCEAVRNDGVLIYAVGLGKPGGSAGYDESLLQRCTGDPTRYFRALNAGQLTAAMQAIGTNINAMLGQ